MSGACPLMVARTTTTRSPSTSPSAAPSSSPGERWKHLPLNQQLLRRCWADALTPYWAIDWHLWDTYRLTSLSLIPAPPSPLSTHSCPAKRRQPETTKPTSRADYLTSSQSWVSVSVSVWVCLSACVRIELSGGSWQRVTDLNNFAKRLPRPLRPSPSHVFVVCAVRQHVKTLNANRRMRSRTWLQIPGNGYGFSRAARWDQQPSRECQRGHGGVGCQRQRFLCQKFYACLVVWSLFLPSWFLCSRGPSEVFTACPLSRRCLVSFRCFHFFFMFSGSILLNARRVWIFNKSSASLTALPAFYL